MQFLIVSHNFPLYLLIFFNTKIQYTLNKISIGSYVKLVQVMAAILDHSDLILVLDTSPSNNASTYRLIILAATVQKLCSGHKVNEVFLS